MCFLVEHQIFLAPCSPALREVWQQRYMPSVEFGRPNLGGRIKGGTAPRVKFHYANKGVHETNIGTYKAQLFATQLQKRPIHHSVGTLKHNSPCLRVATPQQRRWRCQTFKSGRAHISDSNSIIDLNFHARNLAISVELGTGRSNEYGYRDCEDKSAPFPLIGLPGPLSESRQVKGAVK